MIDPTLQACDAANVTEFVRGFPNGHHTFIGEKGVKLSGGQKQRLAIARAIIRQPTILLLDEATSALDSVNEKEVQKALDEMLVAHRGVAVVIAHRLTTIMNCDKIIIFPGSMIHVCELNFLCQLTQFPKFFKSYRLFSMLSIS